jgi:hypothetical protein
MKRYGIILFAVAAVMAFAQFAAAPPAVFAVSANEAGDGVYLAATNTYYLNPDTGVTDDGGSKNAAIGEGMCRSVIYEKALVEIDGGKVYATVRVQLVSNMGAIKFTVQKKAGDPAGYASVSPRIIAEDAGTDTADYRFELPSVTSYIGCSTYVTPMGRDVKFYMNLSGSLTEGSADFVVSVKPKADAAQADAAQDVTQTVTQPADTAIGTGAEGPASAQADTEAAAPSGSAAPVSETGVSSVGTDDGTRNAEADSAGFDSSGTDSNPADANDGGAETANSEIVAAGADGDADSAGADANASGADKAPDSGPDVAIAAVIVIVLLVVAAVVVVVVVLRKRKNINK